MTPPPTTTASTDRVATLCVRCHRLLLSRAGGPSHLPAPALPGSGSDGRRPVAALSAHLVRGSRCFQDTPRVPATKAGDDRRASSTPSAAGDSTAALAPRDATDVDHRPQPSRRGPCRGSHRGTARSGAVAGQFREPLDGDDLEARRQCARSAATSLVAATEVSIEGRSSGDQGGRAGRLAGALRGRADRRGRAPPVASRRRCSKRAGARSPLPASTSSARRPAGGRRPAAPAGRRRSRRRRRDPAAREGAALRRGADRLRRHPFARAAREHGALFFLNDEPDLVEACGADGVHVGQDDEPVAAARAAAGPARWSGSRPTRPPSSTLRWRRRGAARPDQISAGPVWETPTKAGPARRPASS